jgi:carbon-monoxide dehydrogenase medium subunit
MKDVPFVCPHSISEAVGVLASTDGARPIAGGTDLLVQVTRPGTRRPPLLVSLHAIEELREVLIGEDALRLGAGVTLATLAESADIEDETPLLAAAARNMASPPVRSRGTVGGNLCNASPAADLAPPLLVHGARAVIVGPRGERMLAIADFLRGPGRTVLERGELLVAVEVPLLPAGTRTAFLKHQVGACAGLSIISIAIALVLSEETGECLDARVAFGAVAPTAVRAPEVEGILTGSRLDPGTISRAAAVASSQCAPIDDIRATCSHRCTLAGVLLPRAIAAALAPGAGRG